MTNQIAQNFTNQMRQPQHNSQSHPAQVYQQQPYPQYSNHQVQQQDHRQNNHLVSSERPPAHYSQGTGQRGSSASRFLQQPAPPPPFGSIQGNFSQPQPSASLNQQQIIATGQHWIQTPQDNNQWQRNAQIQQLGHQNQNNDFHYQQQQNQWTPIGAIKPEVQPKPQTGYEPDQNSINIIHMQKQIQELKGNYNQVLQHLQQKELEVSQLKEDSMKFEDSQILQRSTKEITRLEKEKSELQEKFNQLEADKNELLEQQRKQIEEKFESERAELMEFRHNKTEEEKKREQNKFFFICSLKAPTEITPEEASNFVKFQPQNWKDLKKTQVNMINIKNCQKIETLGLQYASRFFKRFADQIHAKGYTHYRPVRGDGNCFWRSVSYTYLEKLIFKVKIQEIRNLAANIYRNENPYFKMDDPILTPGCSDKIEKMDFKELVSVLCGHLLQIAESLETKTRAETIKLQQQMYFQNSKFDKAMIYMLRKMTKNFILLHQDAEIHGLPINMLGIADGMELDKYIAEYVMKMGEDAQGGLLNIVPIILRVDIQIVDALKDRENQPLDVEVHQIHTHSSKIENLKLSCPNDGLDFHESFKLYVMRKTGHYDALYRKEDFFLRQRGEQCALDSEDIQDPFFNELQEYFKRRDNEELNRATIFRCHQCQHQCQGNDIKNQQNLDFAQILDPRFYEIPKCKSCNYKLNQVEIVQLFPDRFFSEIESYYKEREKLRQESLRKVTLCFQRLSRNLEIKSVCLKRFKVLKYLILLRNYTHLEKQRNEHSQILARQEFEFQEKILTVENNLKEQKAKTEEQKAMTENWKNEDQKNRTKLLKSIEDNKALKAANEELSAKLVSKQNAFQSELVSKQNAFQREKDRLTKQQDDKNKEYNNELILLRNKLRDEQNAHQNAKKKFEAELKLEMDANTGLRKQFENAKKKFDAELQLEMDANTELRKQLEKDKQEAKANISGLKEQLEKDKQEAKATISGLKEKQETSNQLISTLQSQIFSLQKGSVTLQKPSSNQLGAHGSQTQSSYGNKSNNQHSQYHQHVGRTQAFDQQNVKIAVPQVQNDFEFYKLTEENQKLKKELYTIQSLNDFIQAYKAQMIEIYNKLVQLSNLQMAQFNHQNSQNKQSKEFQSPQKTQNSYESIFKIANQTQIRIWAQDQVSRGNLRGIMEAKQKNKQEKQTQTESEGDIMNVQDLQEMIRQFLKGCNMRMLQEQIHIKDLELKKVQSLLESEKQKHVETKLELSETERLNQESLQRINDFKAQETRISNKLHQESKDKELLFEEKNKFEKLYNTLFSEYSESLYLLSQKELQLEQANNKIEQNQQTLEQSKKFEEEKQKIDEKYNKLKNKEELYLKENQNLKSEKEQLNEELQITQLQFIEVQEKLQKQSEELEKKEDQIKILQKASETHHSEQQQSNVPTLQNVEASQQKENETKDQVQQNSQKQTEQEESQMKEISQDINQSYSQGSHHDDLEAGRRVKEDQKEQKENQQTLEDGNPDQTTSSKRERNALYAHNINPFTGEEESKSEVLGVPNTGNEQNNQNLSNKPTQLQTQQAQSSTPKMETGQYWEQNRHPGDKAKSSSSRSDSQDRSHLANKSEDSLETANEETNKETFTQDDSQDQSNRVPTSLKVKIRKTSQQRQ